MDATNNITNLPQDVWGKILTSFSLDELAKWRTVSNAINGTIMHFYSAPLLLADRVNKNNYTRSYKSIFNDSLYLAMSEKAYAFVQSEKRANMSIWNLKHITSSETWEVDFAKGTILETKPLEKKEDLLSQDMRIAFLKSPIRRKDVTVKDVAACPENNLVACTYRPIRHAAMDSGLFDIYFMNMNRTFTKIGSISELGFQNFTISSDGSKIFGISLKESNSDIIPPSVQLITIDFSSNRSYVQEIVASAFKKIGSFF